MKVDLRLGTPLPQAAELVGDEQRAGGLQQNAQSAAVVLIGALKRGREGPPGGRSAAVQHGAGTLRIVELQQERLVEHARSSQARGMLRVTLDLDRPPFPGGDEQPRRDTVQHH
jgi:hypothetical protein